MAGAWMSFIQQNMDDYKPKMPHEAFFASWGMRHHLIHPTLL